TLHQAGFLEAVASAGTALTVEHARLLRRFTDQVTVAYDGDDAGRSAGLRALRPLLKAGIRPRVAFMPSGEDPDSVVRTRGDGRRRPRGVGRVERARASPGSCCAGCITGRSFWISCPRWSGRNGSRRKRSATPTGS